jgi:serine/threonine-protein kinase/endoribonuclease IRE1
VITRGFHPFGDSLKRQANILSNDYDLKELNKVGTQRTSKLSKATIVGCCDILAEELIKDMINKEAGRRPTAKAILSHPMFWSDKRILAFLQVVLVDFFTK